MSTTRKIPPLWILSLPVLPFGLMFGFTVVTLPQMLAAQGVPGGHIAEAVAVITSPTFWGFLLGPILDVRFRRRTYATVFALIAALAVAFTSLYHSNLLLVEAAMLTGFFATVSTALRSAAGPAPSSVKIRTAGSAHGTPSSISEAAAPAFS
jgi:PAT family beta-lactamase induction signal transducer AmpG